MEDTANHQNHLIGGFFMPIIFIFKVEQIEQIINDKILLGLLLGLITSLFLLYLVEKPSKKPKKSSKSSEKPIIWYKIKK